MAAASALVFAGKTVAASVIKEIVTKAFGYLNTHFGAETMAELKSRLDVGIPQIQAVLDIASPDQVKDKSIALDAWFWKLRDAVEKAEDAMDELEYYELEQKARDRKVSDWGSSFAKMKHKAIKHVKNVRIVDNTVKVFTHRGTLKRLRKAVEDLDRAAARTENILALTDHLKGHAGQQEVIRERLRETGALLPTEVFGRQKEKELVIGWLTQARDEDAEIVVSGSHVSVVSIVGHGGMGKTTLAQSICQDGTVKKHFDKVMWACVSTSFDARSVMSKILQSAGWAIPNADTLEALQKTLQDKLSSVKFLLTLDDVWEDNDKSDQWEKLFAPLRTGKSGSKILLTTRKRSVANSAANALASKSEYLPLQGLEEDENIKLFNRHAFPKDISHDYSNLHPIGEQIAKNLRGCPLVTKVVASHLRDNLSFGFWNNFLDQRLKHFEGNDDGIMNILRLSYYDLPTEMQTCFRYCSIFPQDYEFERDQLVDMWISSGLISQAAVGSQSIQDIGEQYLAQLTRKSFFDVRIMDYDYGAKIKEEYVMHDLMHDLATYVSLGECARIVDAASLENVVRTCTVRHICVKDINNFPVEKIKEITHLHNLRTIIIKMEKINKVNLNIVEELVEGSKSLRLFETELRHTLNFLGKLTKLKHLRFVKLPQISPESISGIVKLYHLTTLSCKDVNIEEKQLRDVGNLDRLQNVTYGSNGWGEFPIGRLNCLLDLNDYCIQGAKGYTISSLKELRSLRRLGVGGLENVGNQEEAKEAKLKKKLYLESLSLRWSECNGAQSSTDELLLDNLEPHANLKRLYISGFSGTRVPYWISKPSVQNLVLLEFNGCSYCKLLPALEKLITLKHLKLINLPMLEKIDQALNVLGDECLDLSLPPSLRTLEVRNCSKLVELPLLPPSLVSLEITHIGLTKLPRIGKLQTGNDETVSSQLQEINIEDCQSLTSLEGSFFEQKPYIGALNDVRITNCVNLESAPLPFEEMNGLQAIDISECPKLRTLRSTQNKFIPPSLRDLNHLVMGQCGDLELSLLRSLQGLTNLTGLSLQNCSVVASLPPADVFKGLKSLRYMWITRCRNLSSLGGLGSLRSLSQLEINKCCKLKGAEPLTWDASGGEEGHLVAPRSSLRITRLQIDLPSLLLVEPLNSLCQTSHLQIEDGSEMESVPEGWLLQNRSSLKRLVIEHAKSLESLPPDLLRDLSSLEKLSLYGAEQLRSLPDLPSSLKKLSILGCQSEMEKKFGEVGSPERNKISHVLQVHIGDSFFIMGKKCGKETYEELWNRDDDTILFWVNQPEDDDKGVESASNGWRNLSCLGLS